MAESRLLERARDALRVRHDSIRTDRSFVHEHSLGSFCAFAHPGCNRPTSIEYLRKILPLPESPAGAAGRPSESAARVRG